MQSLSFNALGHNNCKRRRLQKDFNTNMPLKYNTGEKADQFQGQIIENKYKLHTCLNNNNNFFHKGRSS